MAAIPKPAPKAPKPRKPRRTYTVVPAPGSDPTAADDAIARWLASLSEAPKG